jgi:hypothetical protein
MSHRRKHAKKVFEETIVRPEEGQEIAAVLENRGNRHLVERPCGTTVLCSLPRKFDKLIWIKKGRYVFSKTKKLLY